MRSRRAKAPSASLTIFATVLWLAPAYAEEGADLVKAKGCLECHAVPPGAGPRVQNVGPSFQDIARLFAGLRNAKRMLMMEVMAGSSPSYVSMWGDREYHWGPTPMPPGAARVEVNQPEAEAMVDYILSLK